jgi:hypothetical protein
VHIRHLHWILDNRMVVAWFGHPDDDEENEVSVDVITVEADSNAFTSHGTAHHYDSLCHLSFICLTIQLSLHIYTYACIPMHVDPQGFRKTLTRMTGTLRLGGRPINTSYTQSFYQNGTAILPVYVHLTTPKVY